MTDQARTNAQAAKARILARLKEIEDETKDLQGQLRSVNLFLHEFTRYEHLGPSDPVPNSHSESSVSRASGNPSRQEVADAALAAIVRLGRPMKRRELFDAVAKAGLNIAGKDPLVVFSTMLWREQARITRLDRFGYWPADKPFPAAGYLPNTNP